MRKVKMEALVAAAVITANTISSTIGSYILPKPMLFGGVSYATPVEDQGARLFKTRKHLCYVKYENYKSRYCGIAHNVPEGYDVYKMVPVIEQDEKTYETRSYTIIYYVNNQPVYASLAYNKLTGEYDYCSPGIVVPKEPKLSKKEKRG